MQSFEKFLLLLVLIIQVIVLKQILMLLKIYTLSKISVSYMNIVYKIIQSSYIFLLICDNFYLFVIMDIFIISIIYSLTYVDTLLKHIQYVWIEVYHHEMYTGFWRIAKFFIFLKYCISLAIFTFTLLTTLNTISCNYYLRLNNFFI